MNGPAAKPAGPAAGKALSEQVYGLIVRERLIPPDCLVLAAVSGGADSLALLLLLAELQQRLPFILHCLHVHHGLRGPAADEDMSFVGNWCKRLSVPFHARAADIGRIAAETGTGLELAARLARQAIYHEVAGQLCCSGENGSAKRPVRLALAHHLDDQAETLLLNLGRGTGLDGLAGMPLSDGFLIRPLLPFRRALLERFLADCRTGWRHDATNDADFTMRNRLRHQILPAWEAALGYDPAPLLARAAENISLDRQYLEAEAKKAHQACRRRDGLAADAWLDLHPAMQARVFRLFWAERTGSRQNLEQAHIQNVLAWLPGARSGQGIDLPGRHRLSLQYGQVRLARQRPAASADGLEEPPGQALNLPGITRVESMNVAVVAEFIENGQEIVYNGAVECFWVEKLRDCRLRRRLPGDRIHPWGRTGGKPLKKFLQEQKVPPPERSELILLACGHDVAWLPGFAAGAAYAARTGNDGGQRVCLRLEPINPGNGNAWAGR